MVLPLFGSDTKFAKDAVDNLRDAYEVANKIGLFTWLTCGTCLGYYRENDFIAHDDDIDLGAHIYNFDDLKQQELIKGMEEKGFQLAHILGHRKTGLEISFIRNRVGTEWFFHYMGKDCAWCPVWYRMQQYYCYSPDIFDEFEEVEFKGVKVNVVKQIEKYLEEQYGEWKTPVKGWHCGKPPCIRNYPIL